MDPNKDKKPLLCNKIKNRILFLSPSVREGLEKECCKEDFFSEGDKPIGKGGFGQVWKVRHKATDKIYCIKVMNKQNIIEQKMVEQINREIEIMYKLNHPHIIKLCNHFEDDDNLYLIMHFASKGQLYSLLKKQSKFDQRTTSQYMREIISAVRYLHSFDPPIIHRDIKPENILLDENGRVKLADFGWSNYVDKNNTRKTYCGTPEYLAPEMIRKEGHDTNIDLWDLGVLMFELLTGRPPFAGSNQSELFTNIKKHKIMWPDDFPPLAKNLISKILKQNPKERMSLDEIAGHAWFEKNPQIRPVLADTSLDEKALLESYLINVKPENMKDEITSILEKKPKKIITSTNALNNVMNTGQQQSSFTGAEAPAIPTQQVENVSPITELKEINEKLKKDNAELKQKCDKLEMENKTLKTENLKLKDPNQNKYQAEIELQSLKEELDKYKIMNKDRLGLLTEIEEKSNEIMELKNRVKSFEEELDAQKRSYKLLQAKYTEEKSQNETMEIKFNSFKQQFEIFSKEKEDNSAQYQKKIDLLQAKVLENSYSTEASVSNTTNLLEMIHESINEFQSVFKNKTEKLEKMINDMKEDSSNAEKRFTDLVSEKHLSVIDLFSRIKSSIEEDYLKIKIKVEKENPSKINDRLEWLKKQISELMPYKIKSSNLEIQLSKLEATIKRNEELLELHKANVVTLEKLNIEKDYKLKMKEKYITNLEARLGDVKDYLFRNFSDKLEDFKKWYKF